MPNCREVFLSCASNSSSRTEVDFSRLNTTTTTTTELMPLATSVCPVWYWWIPFFKFFPACYDQGTFCRCNRTFLSPRGAREQIRGLCCGANCAHSKFLVPQWHVGPISIHIVGSSQQIYCSICWVSHMATLHDTKAHLSPPSCLLPLSVFVPIHVVILFSVAWGCRRLPKSIYCFWPCP